MTSVWERLHVDDLAVDVLRDVRQMNDSHHFGRPYMTAYQLAIKLHQRYPEVANALNVDVGGRGIGAHTSMAQYLAHELSRRIRESDGAYPVEGAFLSNDGITALSYANPNGGHIDSSLTGSRKDLSLFRWHEPAS